MSAASFWQAIDPKGLAAREVRMSGTVPLARLPRLSAHPAVAVGDSEAEAEVTFWRDPQGFVVISGRVSARVPAICQRCLEPLAVPVDSTFRLALEDPERTAAVPADMELLEADGDAVVPARLLEEELLLALPMAPVHGDGEVCMPAAVDSTGSGGESGAERPFEILKTLKLD